MQTRLISVTAWFLVLVLPGVSLSDTGKPDTLPNSLHAGAHAQDITPPSFPISVNGGMSDQLANAAHDPLHARCIVLKNRTTSLAIVVCDSCMIPRELMDRAKTLIATKVGIPFSHILISATHAHSCPSLAAVFQSDPVTEYGNFVVEQIAEGVERAYHQLEPAQVGWGSVEERSLLFNRRWVVRPDENSVDMVENPFGTRSDRIITNPGYSNPRVSASIGLIDPELSFVSIQARDGRPIALLANYSLHYVGGVPGDVVSADYYGEFAQRVTRQLDAANVEPPFVAIMSNGTSGDVNNVDFRQVSGPKREPFEQISYVAELLTQDLMKAYSKVEYVKEPALNVREIELVVGVRKPIAEEVTAAERKLASVTERPLKDLSMIYARETALLGKYPTSVKLKLQAIRIGDLGIAACPCEVFTETGLSLKKSSPFKKTFTMSLANGYNGYLPTPEQISLGGYETWRARSSYLSTDAEPKIQTTLQRLLREAKHP